MPDPYNIQQPSSISTIMNSDDEDSDNRNSSQNQLTYKERRREAHTQAEQKRRDAIKRGYEYLQELIPDEAEGSQGASASKVCNVTTENQRNLFIKFFSQTSKAVVLQKAIDYIQQIEGEKKKQEDEVNSLRKELQSLHIIRETYDELVKVHQSSTGSSSTNENMEAMFVPSEVKFRVFQMLMDSLFMTFNEKVGMNNFQELSRCVISWLEEFCTPFALQDLMLNVLEQVKKEGQQQNIDAAVPPNVCVTDMTGINP